MKMEEVRIYIPDDGVVYQQSVLLGLDLDGDVTVMVNSIRGCPVNPKLAVIVRKIKQMIMTDAAFDGATTSERKFE